MAKPTSRSRRDTQDPGFKQQDPSAWISFDPELTGHRKDVRSAAAKSSAAARKATIARKLALKTDCVGARPQDGTERSRKRRKEDPNGSPASASSSATFHSRRPSEISLASLGSAESPASSRTGSPCVMHGPQLFTTMSLVPDTPTFAQPLEPLVDIRSTPLGRAISYVLGIDESLIEDNVRKEPTSFGALRVKSRAISNVHDAVASRRAGSATLLAVALLAAWDLKAGDERASLLHLRAWHQLALPQNILPRDGCNWPAQVTIPETVRISLQCHLALDVYMSLAHFFNGVPNQLRPAQAATGREIVAFFDTIGDLIEPNGLQ